MCISKSPRKKVPNMNNTPTETNIETLHQNFDVTEYKKLVEGMASKIALKYLPDEIDVNDLIQRGWLEVINCLDSYDENAGVKFSTYFYTAVSRGMIKEAEFQKNSSGVSGYEESRKQRAVSIDEEGIESYFAYDSEEVVLENEEINSLRKAMSFLDELERQVLKKTFGIGCEKCPVAKKIAKELGVTEREVNKAHERGMEKIKEFMNGGK